MGNEEVWGTLTVGLCKLDTLDSLIFLTSQLRLSFMRTIAHLHVKNKSSTPRKNTTTNSTTIADPRAVPHKKTELGWSILNASMNCSCCCTNDKNFRISCTAVTVDWIEQHSYCKIL